MKSRKNNRPTAAEVKAWKERWRRINQIEIEELRATTPEESFRQLAALMASVEQMGFGPSLLEQEEENRQRWLYLRKVYQEKAIARGDRKP